MDNRVKEMQEEKTQVEEKYRDIQCKFKNMKATHQEMQSKLYDIEKKKKWRPASDVWWTPPKKYTRVKRERRAGGNKHRIAVQTPRKISSDAVQAPAYGEEKLRLKCNVLWSAEKKR